MNETGQKTETPAVGDTPSKMDEQQMFKVVESIIITTVAHTPGPSEAVHCASEALIALCVAFGISLREMGAFMTRLDENPPTPEEREDARAMVRACYARAQEIKTRAPAVRALIEKGAGR
jgi:hypothetical protein